jgi:hypothetical protein
MSWLVVALVLSAGCSSDPSTGEVADDTGTGGRPDRGGGEEDEEEEDDVDESEPDRDGGDPGEDDDADDAAGADSTDFACTEGARRCSGQLVQICSADATWVAGETCPEGCSAGNCVSGCEAGKTYLGCSFVAVDLDNSLERQFGNNSAAEEQFAITLSNPSDQTATVTIRNGAGSIIETLLTINPGDLLRVPLPRADVDNSVRNRNMYFVDADRPVTAHQFNPLNNEFVYSNDASLLLPRNTLGRTYVVTNWPTEVQQVPLFGPRVFRTFITIVAVQSGVTNVTVQLSSRASVQAGDGVTAMAAGTSASWALQEGEVLSLSSPDTDGVDFSGTLVEADQNIAVFAGAECANVPHGNQYCDHLEEQLIPYEGWGTSYMLPNFAQRGREPSVYRILAYAPITLRTNPSIAGVDGVALAAGQTLETVSTQDFLVEADLPFAVSQYMVGSAYPGPENGCLRDSMGPGPIMCDIPSNPDCGVGENPSAIGDPASLLLIPQNRLLNDYVFLVPAEYREDWITVVHQAGDTPILDGTPVSASSSPVGTTGLAVTRVELPDGTHRIQTTQPAAVYVYGYDCDVSYAYAGGFDLSSVVSP